MFDYRRSTEDRRTYTETLERDSTNDIIEFSRSRSNGKHEGFSEGPNAKKLLEDSQANRTTRSSGQTA